MIGVAHAEARRQARRPPTPARAPDAHRREDVRRLDGAARDLLDVPRMQPLDEAHVELAGRVEVVPEAALDERIDDVGERAEHIEVEALAQEPQAVLRADALEPLGRAIP